MTLTFEIDIFVLIFEPTVQIEPTCAYCTVGSYASLSVRPSLCLSLDNNSYLKKYYSYESETLPLVIKGTGMVNTEAGAFAMTGWAHCQRQVAFLFLVLVFSLSLSLKVDVIPREGWRTHHCFGMTMTKAFGDLFVLRCPCLQNIKW